MTLFEKIINRELPAEIVYEDETCLAFKDASPQAPVHVLLIPKKPIVSLAHLEQDDEKVMGHLMMKTKVVAEQLGLEEGFRTVINTGEKGGQTVFHLHIHILGKRDLQWPPG